MKRTWIMAFLLTAAAGTCLHFLYPLLPVPLVGMIAPVNESVWEHLKLLYWPFLGAGLLLSLRAEDRGALLGAFFAALLLMIWMLPATYYLLEAGFGISSLRLDILLYYLTLLGGFAVAHELARRERSALLGSWLLLPVCFLGVSLLLFSLGAPSVPIFLPPVHSK